MDEVHIPVSLPKRHGGLREGYKAHTVRSTIPRHFLPPGVSREFVQDVLDPAFRRRGVVVVVDVNEDDV
jgi:hypothetical protein